MHFGKQQMLPCKSLMNKTILVCKSTNQLEGSETGFSFMYIPLYASTIFGKTLIGKHNVSLYQEHLVTHISQAFKTILSSKSMYVR